MQTIRTEKKGNYLIVHLDRGTANTIEQVMVDELRAVLKETAADDEVAGMILQGKERFFSAGLDLITLYDYDEKEIAKFWEDFLGLITDLAAWPKPMVASITGHAPAGGCLMSICADYRVMAAGDYKIGLNEVPVGIIVPDMIMQLYGFWIGRGRAYQMLLEGKMVTAKQAVDINLINEAVPENEVLECAEKQLKKYLALHPETWRTTKKNLRTDLLKRMEIDFQEVFGPALKLWWEPSSRMMMKMMVDGLKSKSKAKKAG